MERGRICIGLDCKKMVVNRPGVCAEHRKITCIRCGKTDVTVQGKNIGRKLCSSCERLKPKE